jgi:hypothetical protein
LAVPEPGNEFQCQEEAVTVLGSGPQYRLYLYLVVTPKSLGEVVSVPGGGLHCREEAVSVPGRELQRLEAVPLPAGGLQCL